MKLFSIIKTKIKSIDYSRVLLLVNVGVLTIILCSYLTLNYAILDLKKLAELHRYVWKQEIRSLNYSLTKAIDSVTENDKAQIKIDRQQQAEIRNLTNEWIELDQIVKKNINKLITLRKEMLEDLNKTKKIDLYNVEDIKQANFVIYNSSTGKEGSGSHIKIGENHYILTCAHLVEKETDFVWNVDDNNTMRPSELIKLDREKDLALFRIYMVEDIPYLEISKEIPKEGSEIVIIGNPYYMNDTITDGIISQITKSEYIFTNIIYFGNSGGAILYKGKIVGVTTKVSVYYKSKIPDIFVMMGSGTKLEEIQEFLKGIE